MIFVFLIIALSYYIAMTVCGFVPRVDVEPTVGCGETLRVECPPGGVTGRHLIIQLEGQDHTLTMCEVEAYIQG